MPVTTTTTVTAPQPGNNQQAQAQTREPKKREALGEQKTPVSNHLQTRQDIISPGINEGTRARLAENYEKPVSSRDSWWRVTIRETPVPGAYQLDDFLSESQKKPMSYRFKSVGRKHDPQPQIGKGAVLLPGAYKYEDLAQRAENFRHTYGFKDSSRDAKDVLNFGKKDKDINIPPNVYDTQKYLTVTVEKQPSKHSMFKSQSQRFPTIQFKPKDGPAPGHYEEKPVVVKKVVSSSFQSKTPRFPSSHTKVPGPGSYATTYKPMTSTITKMGRQYGLFFSPEFNTTV